MKGDTNMKARGKVFYFRRRVPADLGEYEGKKEIRYSLNTTDKHDAKRKAREEYLKWEAKFDAVRTTRKNGHDRAIVPEEEELTTEQARALIENWLAAVLEDDEEARAQGLSEAAYDNYENVVEVFAAEYAEQLARGDTSETRDRAVRMAQDELGITLHRDSPSAKRLAYELLKGYAVYMEAIAARQCGEIVPSRGRISAHPQPALLRQGGGNPQAAPARAPSGAPPVTLAVVIERWAKENTPRERTLFEWRRIVREFTEATNGVALHQLTRAHVVAYKDSLVNAGKAPATTWKNVTAIGTLLRWAKNNELVTDNVAEGVTVKHGKRAKSSRLPYSEEDMCLIFSSPIYTQGDRPRGGKGEAAFWLPLLAAHTGARREELCQLLTSDVRVAEGINYLALTDEEGSKQLKTDPRRVPIHPLVEQVGFLRYVEQRRAARDARLFPQLTPDAFGRYGETWGKWFGNYSRKVIGITDSRKVFHSFRHSFKSACRRAAIEEEIHEALTGHAGGTVGRNYGDYPLPALAEAIKKLKYAGLDLSKLKVAT